MSPPTISAYPLGCLRCVVETLAYQGYLMVCHVQTRLLENATSVALELVGSPYSAGNGSILELFLHVVDSGYRPHFGEIDALVLDSPAVFARGSYGGGESRAWQAVLAHLGARARGVTGVGCQLRLAGVVHQAVSLGELLHSRWISSVAAASCIAVHHDLGRQRPVIVRFATSPLQDIGPVCDGRSGALRPARTALLRNMLLFGPRQLVDPIHISPEYRFG